MAQNITLLGASYADVPAVILPKSGGGTASFTDVSDTTAAASDVASGKYFYTAAGVKTAGTSSGGGGGGMTTVASGTFTGSNSYNFALNVGKKMPKTNFYVRYAAKPSTVFPYNTNYKPVIMEAVCLSDDGHFDLSIAGSEISVESDITVDINESGTITTKDVSQIILHGTVVRNSAVSFVRANRFRIVRESDHFDVYLCHYSSSYAYPSGIVYDWKIVYFGSNPSTDIIEIT